MNPQTQLEEEGYKVRFSHMRISDEELDQVISSSEPEHRKLKTSGLPEPKFKLRERAATIAPRGGYTRVQVLKDDEIVAEGEAWCNPEMDNFNKKLGREIALGRAIKQLEYRGGS